LLLIVAVFVGHIPIWEDYDTRGKPFPFSSFFGVPDFEKDIVRVLQLLVEVALKSVGPLGIVFDDGFKVVEEFPVSIYTRDFNVGATVLNEITLEERNGLQSLQANNQSIKGLIEFKDLLKKAELHWLPPRLMEREQDHPARVSGQRD
jgi:hypothetical protein